MASDTTAAPTLTTIDRNHGFDFQAPIKRINDGDDVTFFLQSKAYADIMTFIFQLNTAMIPRKIDTSVREWNLDDPDIEYTDVVKNIAKLLEALTSIINEAPPDPGPRRFGNISFRKWYDIVRERTQELLTQHLPASILSFKSVSSTPAQDELSAYLLGSFGSSQRLDYGTGHELSFLAFLACLYKIGAFSAPTDKPEDDGSTERALVIGVIQPYLTLIRKLILTYTLEPAGSHGVWGLDDHSFLPYIFGSAQYCPPITSPLDIVAEGSLSTAPNPGDVAKLPSVTRLRTSNMYFSAIGFILDVKKGPFWEHSPILYDISGVQKGWAKINKGMIKMYNAEVLSKFPVVQHFPFGGMFKWEKDPNAKSIAQSVHTSSQPKTRDKGETVPSATSSTSAYASPRPGPPSALRDPLDETSARGPAGGRTQPPLRNPMAAPPGGVGTAAPWATSTTSQPPLRDPMTDVGTAAPRATNSASRPALRDPSTGVGTAAPWATAPGTQVPSGLNQPTRVPWTSRTPAPPPPSSSSEAGTKAPWADKKS